MAFRWWAVGGPILYIDWNFRAYNITVQALLHIPGYVIKDNVGRDQIARQAEH